MEEQSIATSDDLLLITAIYKNSENVLEIGEALFALDYYIFSPEEGSAQFNIIDVL